MKSTINENKIVLQGKDRTFRAILHFALYEKARPRSPKNLVAVSYMGNPEAAIAISAGILEGRFVEINGKEFHKGKDKMGRIERKIGLGDVVHSVVYNSKSTIAGIVEPDSNEVNTESYIIAPDGNIEKALANHVMARYGLPEEWEMQYYSLFRHLTDTLEVEFNPVMANMWPHIQAIRLEASEKTIIDIMDRELRLGVLRIPHSDVHGVFDPAWSMKEYMIANSDSMAQKLSKLKPKHSPGEALDPAIASMARVPFPAQAHMIQALVNALEEDNSEFCSADMGTGKSIMSTGIAHVMSERRKRNGAKKGFHVLLSAPGITLAKWKHKEILGTLPHAKVDIIRSDKQALHMYKKFRNGYRVPPGEIHFTLIGIDKAKMGAEPQYAGIWKRIQGTKSEYGWHCPDCGRLQMKKQSGEWITLEWGDIAEGKAPEPEVLREAAMSHNLNPNGLPKDMKLKWVRSKKYTKCFYRKDGFQEVNKNKRTAECGTKMYRGAVRSRGETKKHPVMNISKVFKRMTKVIDLYIADEVHKSKASGSGRGDAFASMVKSAKKCLMLTGTLVNGKSSSIKELLWRTYPKALLDSGFDNHTGDIQWAEKFGKLEQIIRYDEEEQVGHVTVQRRKAQQPTEAPGIAPHMTAEFLLHKAGFLELGDMGLPLVELKEIPIFVDMDPVHKNEYDLFHQQMYDTCAKLSAMGVKGAWSKFIPSTIMYADRPDLGAHIEMGENLIIAEEIKGYHSKEKRLVELVKKELSEDRGIVIYNWYTGNYGMNQRTKKLLADHGIHSVILDESNVEKRAEIIHKMEEAGEKVIITNMKAVEVGLDLLYWPTIINNQLTYEVSVFRQSNRRNWRIGQEKECRCYILAYNGTQQMAQFLKLMSGRGHALMTEGRLDKSDLAQFSRDSQSSLASDLAACFADSDVADAWTALAAKDLADVEMVDEASFKEVISSRMKMLANETRRLCGLPPIGETEEFETEAPSRSVEWDKVIVGVGDQMDLFSLVDEPAPLPDFIEFITESTGYESFFIDIPLKKPEPAAALDSFFFDIKIKEKVPA
ncbi:helicase-related protein [Cytobacillus oceanisediminis]|uniref:helicase-related protein n=1 Tax=Cytobacillus oceanisediminis TaxID=665099 RepID=UPI001FB4E127|nr:helicase-related protein [Cytobacillus oceanisediminis]UOE58004.1 DEAD/DEAH box helicase [Cytobacillus oceanisediminis]